MMNSSPESAKDGNESCASFWRDNCVLEFFRDSSLHGFKYVGNVDRKIAERIFWVVGIAGCIGFSVYLIQIGVVEPLTASPVLISFRSSEISIDQIPFPAVTVCNVNKIKKSVVEKLERDWKNLLDCDQELQSGAEVSCDHLMEPAQNALIGLQYVGTLCKRVVSFAKAFNYSSLLGVVHYDLETEYHMTNVTLVTEDNPEFRKIVNPILDEALMNCSEMVLRCIWQNTNYDCKDLFYAVPTEFGRCCVFNMVPQFILRNINKSSPLVSKGERKMNKSVLDAWSEWNIDDGLVKESGHRKGSLDLPKHQEKAGMNTGLSILLNPQLDEYHCNAQDSEGFRILAHSPIEFPHVSESGKAVRLNAETFVGVQAEITVVDKHVKPMTMDKRNCYFQGEFGLKTSKFYTEANCVDECIANITFGICRCLQYHQPREPGREICGGSLDPCVKNVFRDIEEAGVNVKCPKCYPSCTDIQYFMETNRLPMRSDVPLWIGNDTGLEEAWAKSNLSIVHVYFSSDYVESRVRKSLYGFRQVLANAGGLLGLTLGFSIISLVEPIYFFTIRYFFSKEESAEGRMNELRGPKSNGAISTSRLNSSTVKKQSENLRNKKATFPGGHFYLP